MYSSAQQIYPHIYNVIDVPLIYLVNLFSAFHIIIHNYLMGTYRFTSTLLCRFLHIFLALLYRHQKRPHLFVIAYLLLCQFIRNNEPIILWEPTDLQACFYVGSFIFFLHYCIVTRKDHICLLLFIFYCVNLYETMNQLSYVWFDVLLCIWKLWI